MSTTHTHTRTHTHARAHKNTDCLTFDIRSSKPVLTKDHNYGARKVKFVVAVSMSVPVPLSVRRDIRAHAAVGARARRYVRLYPSGARLHTNLFAHVPPPHTG
jgi:hypothetical protein